MPDGRAGVAPVWDRRCSNYRFIQPRRMFMAWRRRCHNFTIRSGVRGKKDDLRDAINGIVGLL
ncbi:MAG: hypothetical protein CM15mP71_0030 [Candidatus Poseidoniales archaeon]|nr:MAG: hypothetical protein CM15mP71_0030 [Candidatus Poseidoniales archaeon]